MPDTPINHSDVVSPAVFFSIAFWYHCHSQICVIVKNSLWVPSFARIVFDLPNRLGQHCRSQTCTVCKSVLSDLNYALRYHHGLQRRTAVKRSPASRQTFSRFSYRYFTISTRCSTDRTLIFLSPTVAAFLKHSSLRSRKCAIRSVSFISKGVSQ